VRVLETTIPGLLVVEPRVFGDDRGFFLETFNAARFAEHALPTEFVQDNHSRSAKGVLRGLHYQRRNPQGKLVSVVRGEVWDVAVDIREGSPTFGRWFGTTLSEQRHQLLWIPPGFAHGFCVLSESADFLYKCTTLYDPADDRGIRWNDPALGIEWPIADPILSAKDRALPSLAEAAGALPSLPARPR
jgi:dTDP-4-dehydrorhamnose 3,5-epimerase